MTKAAKLPGIISLHNTFIEFKALNETPPISPKIAIIQTFII